MRYAARGKRMEYFELFDEQDNALGRLDFDGFFRNKVSINVADAHYEIHPVNFWQNKIEVSREDVVYAELKFNWAGNIIIEMTDGRQYLLRPNFWHTKYTLYTREEFGIITLQSDFRWSNMSFEYDIETDDNYTEGKEVLLLLMLVYSYLRIRRSTYVAAT